MRAWPQDRGEARIGIAGAFKIDGHVDHQRADRSVNRRRALKPGRRKAPIANILTAQFAVRTAIARRIHDPVKSDAGGLDGFTAPAGDLLPVRFKAHGPAVTGRFGFDMGRTGIGHQRGQAGSSGNINRRFCAGVAADDAANPEVRPGVRLEAKTGRHDPLRPIERSISDRVAIQPDARRSGPGLWIARQRGVDIDRMAFDPQKTGNRAIGRTRKVEARIHGPCRIAGEFGRCRVSGLVEPFEAGVEIDLTAASNPGGGLRRESDFGTGNPLAKLEAFQVQPVQPQLRQVEATAAGAPGLRQAVEAAELGFGAADVDPAAGHEAQRAPVEGHTPQHQPGAFVIGDGQFVETGAGQDVALQPVNLDAADARNLAPVDLAGDEVTARRAGDDETHAREQDKDARQHDTDPDRPANDALRGSGHA